MTIQPPGSGDSTAPPASARDIGEPPQSGGRWGTHGMIVFGAGDRTFFSHIPMFGTPHDMQAIVEVQLNGEVPALDGLYTWVPRPFSLDDMVEGRLVEISGTLFQGNFESGGQALGPVDATVTQVISATPLTGEGDAGGPLRYFAVGTPEEVFLIHPIGPEDDFDQIVSARVTGLTQGDVEEGVFITIPDRENTFADRLKPGDRGDIAAQTDDGREVTFTVQEVISTLVGPNFVDHGH
jgi:hypothetical protein